MRLTFRVTDGTRTHTGPFIHLGDNKSAPIVLPWLEANRDQRALVHLITLNSQVDANLIALYDVIQFAAKSTTLTYLGPHYGRIQFLENTHATLDALRTTLRNTARRSAIKAIDLVMSTHGLDNDIYFYPDTPTDMTDVVSVLRGIESRYRNKFRILFSTACFGRNHLDEWLDVGFEVASGARGIYADSALSYPAFLNSWRLGMTFQQAVAAANSSDPGHTQDQVASEFFTSLGGDYADYSSQVDSTRETRGRGGLRISYAP